MVTLLGKNDGGDNETWIEYLTWVSWWEGVIRTNFMMSFGRIFIMLFPWREKVWRSRERLDKRDAAFACHVACNQAQKHTYYIIPWVLKTWTHSGKFLRWKRKRKRKKERVFKENVNKCRIFFLTHFNTPASSFVLSHRLHGEILLNEECLDDVFHIENIVLSINTWFNSPRISILFLSLSLSPLKPNGGILMS